MVGGRGTLIKKATKMSELGTWSKRPEKTLSVFYLINIFISDWPSGSMHAGSKD